MALWWGQICDRFTLSYVNLLITRAGLCSHRNTRSPRPSLPRKDEEITGKIGTCTCNLSHTAISPVISSSRPDKSPGWNRWNPLSENPTGGNQQKTGASFYPIWRSCLLQFYFILSMLIDFTGSLQICRLWVISNTRNQMQKVHGSWCRSLIQVEQTHSSTLTNYSVLIS